jgi:hypothetical protein
MDVPGNEFPSMWTVPVLSVGMDKSWTARDKWTGCPPFAHPHLGQVLDWTIDLTTAPWITAHLDVTVNHTDHRLRLRIFLNDLEHKKGTQTDQFLFGDSGFTLFFVWGCALDDSDRCVQGFVYHTESRTCIPVDTASEDSGMSQDGSIPNGFGQPCVDDDACAAYDEDYCVIDPLTQTGKYCSLTDCTPGGCPNGYSCCDCTLTPLDIIAKIVVCLTTEDASIAGNVGQCNCD